MVLGSLHHSRYCYQFKWQMDSGAATNHVIVDSSNLHHKVEHNEPGKLIIGNRQGLPITYTGFSNIIIGPDTLQLRYMLHVPKVNRHKLSIASPNA